MSVIENIFPAILILSTLALALFVLVFGVALFLGLMEGFPHVDGKGTQRWALWFCSALLLLIVLIQDQTP
jgi:hypothetical protein